MTDYVLGKGSSFSISTDSGATYLRVLQLKRVIFRGQQANFDDITTMDSPEGLREYAPTLIEPGVATLEGVWAETDPGQNELLTAFDAQQRLTCKLVFVDIDGQAGSLTRSFAAYAATRLELTAAVDAACKFTVDLKVTGPFADSAPIAGQHAPFVQVVNGNTAATPSESGGAATGSFPLPSATIAGDTLLVCIETYSPTGTFAAPTITDGTNTYSLIGSTTPFYRSGFSTYQKSYAFIAAGIAGGAVTVAAAVAANGYGFKIVVAEYGPCTGVDTFATATAPDGGGYSLPEIALTTSAANESLVFLSSFGVVPSGYALRLLGGNDNASLELYDAPAAVAGEYTVTSNTFTDQYAGAFLLALKMPLVT